MSINFRKKAGLFREGVGFVLDIGATTQVRRLTPTRVSVVLPVERVLQRDAKRIGGDLNRVVCRERRRVG